MAGSGTATPGEIRSMLRLSHTLHTSSEPTARKKLLLAGMCELLGADSALTWWRTRSRRGGVTPLCP